MTDDEFIYGWGRTKHIPAPEDQRTIGRYGVRVGLCGAEGGYPLDSPDRPICKHCVRLAAADREDEE